MTNRVLVLNLNPAYDVTIHIKKFKINTLNRAVKTVSDAGGKGKNVANVLKEFKIETKVLGFVGKRNYQSYEKYFKDNNIEYEFIFSKGNIRTNYKIFDEHEKSITEINTPGFIVSEDEIKNFMCSFDKEIRKSSYLVCTGSVPEGVLDNTYSKLIKKAKKHGVKTILDAAGELLKVGLEDKPYAIKPNLEELKEITQLSSNNIDDIVKEAFRIRDMGIDRLLISLGGKGAIYISATNTLYAKPLEVNIKSTVGAGDAMIGAYVYADINKMNDLDTIKLAVMAASNSITKEGTKSCDADFVLKNKNKVMIEML